jgi:phospholipid/cholesterol/gamma-HCH transport system substrate-binding protein
MSSPAGSGSQSARERRARRAAANAATESQHGLSIREQLARYRRSFATVIAMVVIAALVGGYVLSNERLSLPCGFPALGKCYFKLGAYFRTAQALEPGQGQAVTIAGAKIGEIASVEQTGGRALVEMNLQTKYANGRIYKNATLLMRPKTQLQDLTVELDPGTPSAGLLHSGTVIGVDQTAPNIDFDQFLASLDAETRTYLQELLAGGAEGLKDNGTRLAATFRQFDPLARNTARITRELQNYHGNIAGAIHAFSSLVAALATVEKQIAELVVSSNTNFRVFAENDRSVQRTLQLLPGALAKTQAGLGKLATAANVVGPTLRELHPFAESLAAAERAGQTLARKTTPIIADQIRPFARAANPALAKFAPGLANFATALPGLTKSFTRLNELLNELAFNPSASEPGFLFYGSWLVHDLNSVFATADAHGAVGNTLVYFNCELLKAIRGAAEINGHANLLTGLFNFPGQTQCEKAQATGGAATAARVGGGG